MVDLSRYRGKFEFNPAPHLAFSLDDILNENLKTTFNGGEVVGSIDKISSHSCVFLKPTMETLIRHKKARDDVDLADMGCIYPLTEEAAAALREALWHGGIPLYISGGSKVKFSSHKIPTGAVLGGSQIILGENANFDHAIARTNTTAYIGWGGIYNSVLKDAHINSDVRPSGAFDEDDPAILKSREVANRFINIKDSALQLVKSTGDLDLDHTKLNYNIRLRDSILKNCDLTYQVAPDCDPYAIFGAALRANKSGIELNSTSLENVKARFVENKDAYRPDIPPKDWDGLSDYQEFPYYCYHQPKLGLKTSHSLLKNMDLTAKGKGEITISGSVVNHLVSKANDDVVIKNTQIDHSHFAGKTTLHHTDLDHVISQNDLKAVNTTIKAQTDHPLFIKSKLNLKDIALHLSDGLAVLPTSKNTNKLTIDGDPANQKITESKKVPFNNEQIKRSKYFTAVDHDYAYQAVKKPKHGLYQVDTDLAQYVGKFPMPEQNISAKQKSSQKQKSNDLDL